MQSHDQRCAWWWALNFPSMIIDVPIQHPLIDTFLYDPSATLKGTSWPPGREQAGKHVCAKMDATGMFSCASLLDGISGVARGLSRVVFRKLAFQHESPGFIRRARSFRGWELENLLEASKPLEHPTRSYVDLVPSYTVLPNPERQMPTLHPYCHTKSQTPKPKTR